MAVCPGVCSQVVVDIVNQQCPEGLLVGHLLLGCIIWLSFPQQLQHLLCRQKMQQVTKAALLGKVPRDSCAAVCTARDRRWRSCNRCCCLPHNQACPAGRPVRQVHRACLHPIQQQCPLHARFLLPKRVPAGSDAVALIAEEGHQHQPHLPPPLCSCRGPAAVHHLGRLHVLVQQGQRHSHQTCRSLQQQEHTSPHPLECAEQELWRCIPNLHRQKHRHAMSLPLHHSLGLRCQPESNSQHDTARTWSAVAQW